MATTRSRTTLQQVMNGAAIDKTLAQVASMAGLSRKMVNQVVESGLPLMAKAADEDPYVFKAMFAQSRRALPEPTPEYFARLGEDPRAQQALADAFRAIYGAGTDALNREAGRQANASEAQASQVLAAAMPAVVNALAVQNTQQNEMGLGRLLRTLYAQPLSHP